MIQHKMEKRTMEKRTVVKARQEFSEITNKAHYNGVSTMILNHGKPHALITSPEFSELAENRMFLVDFLKKITKNNDILDKFSNGDRETIVHILNNLERKKVEDDNDE